MNAKKMSHKCFGIKAVLKKMNEFVGFVDYLSIKLNTTLQLIPLQEKNSVMDDYANMVVLLCWFYSYYC